MTYYTAKIVITLALIVGISELSKRSTFAGAILASVPLISIIAMSWLYYETNDIHQVSELSKYIFWLVIPSLIFFIAFPLFVNLKFSYLTALFSSMALTILGYFIMILTLKTWGLFPD